MSVPRVAIAVTVGIGGSSSDRWRRIARGRPLCHSAAWREQIVSGNDVARGDRRRSATRYTGEKDRVPRGVGMTDGTLGAAADRSVVDWSVVRWSSGCRTRLDFGTIRREIQRQEDYNDDCMPI